jgi:hypothetical protein
MRNPLLTSGWVREPASLAHHKPPREQKRIPLVAPHGRSAAFNDRLLSNDYAYSVSSRFDRGWHGWKVKQS